MTRRLFASLLAATALACSEATFAPALVALSVGNIKASEAWYMRNAGFELKWERAFPDAHLVMAVLERNCFQLELVQLDGSAAPAQLVPGTNPARIRGFGKLAFRVDDVDALAERLRRNGVKFQFEPRDDAQERTRSFIVLDNEGNWIEFIGPTPTAPTVPDAARLSL
jgi:catechol 2,3-dioxygenase-like lactoylglutathione lyase family enzyme